MPKTQPGIKKYIIRWSSLSTAIIDKHHTTVRNCVQVFAGLTIGLCMIYTQFETVSDEVAS